MKHEDALAYLDSLEVLGIRPGLERIASLLARLGNPHHGLPAVIVAGTNGKGSVSAFLAAILMEAGIEPGVYTSPHLVRFEERIAVAGEPVGEEEVASLTHEVREAIEAGRRKGEETPTYFEATTALAFLHFSRRRVPIAILEVGMGGRFDATNVVVPALCAITPISMDHMQWLGPTLETIAYQKAGILKPDVPAAVSPQPPQALGVIVSEAARVGAPLRLVADCAVVPAPAAGPHRGAWSDPPRFDLTTPAGTRYERLTLSLRGAHQVGNAVTAVLLAEQLSARGLRGIDPSSIARGLARAVWPGRLEMIPGGAAAPDLLLDGAHNPAGCESLAAYLRDSQPGRRLGLVFASMKDKPAAEMLAILCPRATDVVVTSLPVPRGESPETLLRLARAHHSSCHAEPRIEEALLRARHIAGPEGLVVVSGSLYLVGEVKKLIGPPPVRRGASPRSPAR
jgi:dihydrofolate synthase / folylpolyglutamate synthase